jgi:outer membrane protein assembly factor BamA
MMCMKRLLMLVGFAMICGMTGLHGQVVQPKSTLLTRTKFLPIPLVSYNRSYGITVGALVNAFTQLNPGDSISPPSRTSIGLGYTQNKSWFLFATQKLYLQQDLWRVSWGLGLGKSNFQFYDDMDGEGNGVFIDYQTHVEFFSAQVMRHVGKRFYTGLKYQVSKSTTEFEGTNKPDEIAFLSGLGIPVSYDTRNYVYYPTAGWFLNATLFANMEWLGSDLNFSNISVNANNFKKLSQQSILATRFFGYTGLGTVPFVGQKVVGGKDLRGYTKGEYRSDMVMALQSEWRYNFKEKWGLVGFGGFAYAAKTASTPASGLLPSIGTGIRFLALPKQQMRIGVDVAAGKNDWGLYIRVGEAF